MHPALEQLQKIVSLEPGNGYSNKAVIGGLQKMLVFWEPNARRGGLPPEFIETVIRQVQAYPDQSPAERPATIQAILDMVRTAAAAPPPAPAAGPSTARPMPVFTPRPATPSRSHPLERQAPPASQPPSKPASQQSSVLLVLPPSIATAAPVTRPPSAPAEQAAPITSPSTAEPTPQPRTPERPATSASHPPAARQQPQGGSRGGRPPKPAKPPVQQQRSRRPEVSDLEETPIDPRPRRAAAARPLRSEEPLNKEAGLDAPLTVLHGVGPETAKDYERLGITSLRDLLLHFPRRYDDYSQLKTINRLEVGEECSVIATVWEAHVRPFRGGQRKMLKVILSDSTGTLEVTFFNQEFLAKQFTPGRQIVISGRIDHYLGRLTIVPKEWEDLDRELLSTGRIVPVYRANEGLRQKNIRKLTSQVIRYWAHRQPDPLPADIVASAGLVTYSEALAQVHFPDNQEKLAAARHRLAFDELLILQLGSLHQRRDWQANAAAPRVVGDEWLLTYLATMPYALTSAQQRAVADIRADMARPVPMNRLLQGDVGSGKTAVAAAAMAVTIQAGAQAAIMAPTSILAEQHFRTLSGLLAPVLGDPGGLRLLQGSSTALEKEEVYAGLRSGEIKAVVGTHALIEGPVEFANLGLVIVDEQHRFGVAQRAALRGKGTHPHLLVMTATPIPRSLALTIYGDLDLSLLDEMPPGRQPIATRLLSATERERGYAFVRSQLEKGRQAFIIFPLVEESDKIDAKAAVAEHARLQQEVFADYKLGLLHGRLKPDEKDATMAAFHAGEYQVLVSTSVVEVGVDVPNATVILIEGANRFGLAQLHQFRGRVGRGEHASVCLLVSDNPLAPGRKDERLQAMEESQDGFYLAEKDLGLRGPGDFLGTRQSGSPLLMARLTDLETIEKARRAARQLFERDPELKAPEHQLLAERFNQFWTPGSGDAS